MTIQAHRAAAWVCDPEDATGSPRGLRDVWLRLFSESMRIKQLASSRFSARQTLQEHSRLLVWQATTYARCYVPHGVPTRCLTSESGERTNRGAMITAIRNQLDTCAATGSYSPSWLHDALGEFMPRVNTVES